MAFFFHETTRNATDTGWDEQRFGPFETAQQACDAFYQRCLGSQSPNDPADCKHNDGRPYTVGEVVADFRETLLTMRYLDLEDGSWRLTEEN